MDKNEFCENCGKKLLADDQFCAFCGEPCGYHVNVEETIPVKRICENCERELKEDEKFCVDCGKEYINTTDQVEVNNIEDAQTIDQTSDLEIKASELSYSQKPEQNPVNRNSQVDQKPAEPAVHIETKDYIQIKKSTIQNVAIIMGISAILIMIAIIVFSVSTRNASDEATIQEIDLEEENVDENVDENGIIHVDPFDPASVVKGYLSNIYLGRIDEALELICEDSKTATQRSNNDMRHLLTDIANDLNANFIDISVHPGEVVNGFESFDAEVTVEQNGEITVIYEPEIFVHMTNEGYRILLDGMIGLQDLAYWASDIDEIELAILAENVTKTVWGYTLILNTINNTGVDSTIGWLSRPAYVTLYTCSGTFSVDWSGRMHAHQEYSSSIFFPNASGTVERIIISNLSPILRSRLPNQSDAESDTEIEIYSRN